MKSVTALKLAAVSAVLFTAPAAEATVFRVGSGPSCTHSRLSDAIAAAAANGPASDEIRVSQPYNEVPIYAINNQSLRVLGGYPSCSSSLPEGKTYLRGIGNGSSVFRITGGVKSSAVVEIGGFDLDGAELMTGGSAVSISGRVQVGLKDTHIGAFYSQRGGAILVDDGGLVFAPVVSLSNVLIENNDAREGGGIYCRGRASITLQPDVTIKGNAGEKGGGVAIYGCTWNQRGAILTENMAQVGGAIYAAEGAYVHLAWGALNGRMTAPPDHRQSGHLLGRRAVHHRRPDPTRRLRRADALQ